MRDPFGKVMLVLAGAVLGAALLAGRAGVEATGRVEERQEFRARRFTLVDEDGKEHGGLSTERDGLTRVILKGASETAAVRGLYAAVPGDGRAVRFELRSSGRVAKLDVSDAGMLISLTSTSPGERAGVLVAVKDGEPQIEVTGKDGRSRKVSLHETVGSVQPMEDPPHEEDLPPEGEGPPQDGAGEGAAPP